MLTITQIEDALLALPDYKSLPRASENLRKMALYCASLYHADYLKLLSFSQYPAELVKETLQALRDNDVIQNGVIVESFLRARIKNSAQLIARLQGKAATATAKPAAKKANMAALMRDGIVAVLKQCNGAGFGWPEVRDHLSQQGYTVGGCKGNFDEEVKRMMKAGTLVRLTAGNRHKPGTYGLPTTKPATKAIAAPAVPSSQAVAVVPKPASSPVSEIATATVEVLPGPQESTEAGLLSRLHYLKASRIADVEAIQRTLMILEREGVR